MEKLFFTYGLLTGVAASFVFVFISICVVVRGGINKENQNEGSNQPAQPKTGHWVQDDIASNIFRCSECGCDAPVDPTAGCEIKSNFCYMCGADMRGGK